MSLESMVVDNIVSLIALVALGAAGLARVRSNEKAIATISKDVSAQSVKIATHDTSIAVLASSAGSTHEMLKDLATDVHDMRKLLAKLAANLDKRG